MLRIAQIGIGSLIFLGIVAWSVDYYYYSWTSYIRPFGCEYKYVIGKANMENPSEEYDLNKIDSEIKSDSRYESTLLLGGKHIELSRMFDNLNYTIKISKYITSTGKLTEINFENSRTVTMTKIDGVIKTTPDYEVLQNIGQMIDDMPLIDAQKTELKSRVTVRCSSSSSMGAWR